MKTAPLFLSVFALAIVGCADRDTASNPSTVTTDTPVAGTPVTEPTLAQRAEAAGNEVMDRGRVAANEVSTALSAKMREWDITPEKIQQELRETGRVVRTKSAAMAEKAGAVMDNARVVTVINGKYATDPQVSAFAIDVDAAQGVVTLNGNVSSAESVAKAIVLALDTEGVTQVVSNLRVSAQ